MLLLVFKRPSKSPKKKAGQKKRANCKGMARSRAVQFADSWKERRQQPQPNKQLRKLGAVALVAASVELSAVAGARKAADWCALPGRAKSRSLAFLLTWHSLLALGMSVVRSRPQMSVIVNRHCCFGSHRHCNSSYLYVATKEWRRTSRPFELWQQGSWCCK